MGKRCWRCEEEKGDPAELKRSQLADGSGVIQNQPRPTQNPQLWASLDGKSARKDIPSREIGQGVKMWSVQQVIEVVNNKNMY